MDGVTWLAATVVVLGSPAFNLSAQEAGHRPPPLGPVRNGDIYVINADGTGATRLTQDPAEEFDPAWSPSGKKIAFSRFTGSRYQIFVMNADGTKATQLTHADAAAFDAAWSRDGRRIAYTRCGATCSIYVMKADGGSERRLTFSADSGEQGPSWSPDGAHIAFADFMGIAVSKRKGGDWQRLTDGPADDRNPAWSPSGRAIAFDGSRGLFNGDIYVVDPDGSEISNVTESAPLDSNPSWSPNGRRIAFMRRHNKYYRARLWVMSADGSDQKSLGVMGDAYSRPSWSPDGKRLAYSWMASCLVPKVAGTKLRQARNRIRRRSCALGHISFRAARHPRGVVLLQWPNARAEGRIGSKVDLVVSLGRRR